MGGKRGTWKSERGTDPQRNVPRSTLAVEDVRLLRALRWLEAEVPIRPRRRAAAAGSAGEEALLHQERLVHLFQGAGVLTDGGGDGAEPDWPALELLDDRLEDAAVHVVQPELVHVKPLQRFERDRGGDGAGGAHLGVIAHPFQQPVRDARRAAAAPGDP